MTATEPQLQYLRSLARQNRLSEQDLALIKGVERLEDLSKTEASNLIDWLKETPTGDIGRLVAEAKGQLVLL